MEFELGTVVACDETGCEVRLVESGQTIRASFSQQVKDSIRIRRQQLVAIDQSSGQPEIAWRWYRGVVEATNESGVAVRRLDLPAGTTTLVANDSGVALNVGDSVFYGNHGAWTVIDRAGNNAPSRPDVIAERYFPAIREALTA